MRIREHFESVVSVIFLICGALFCLWLLWDYFGLYVPVTEEVSEVSLVSEQPKLFDPKTQAAALEALAAVRARAESAENSGVTDTTEKTEG